MGSILVWIILVVIALLVRVHAPLIFYGVLLIASITLLIFWFPVGVLMSVVFFLLLKEGMS